MPPLSGVKPRSENGSQMRASSATTEKSEAATTCSPIPAIHPRAPQTIGVCTVAMSGMRRWACEGSRRWMLPARGLTSPRAALRPTMSKPLQK